MNTAQKVLYKAQAEFTHRPAPTCYETRLLNANDCASKTSKSHGTMFASMHSLKQTYCGGGHSCKTWNGISMVSMLVGADKVVVDKVGIDEVELTKRE